MKIWGDIPKIPGIYDRQQNVKKINGAPAAVSRKDQLSISGQAKDYQAVIRTLKNIPDIRRDKVDELSEKYGSGSYDISGRDIADKIIKSIIDRKV